MILSQLLDIKNTPNIIPYDKANMFGDRLLLLKKSITKDLENMPSELQEWIRKGKSKIVDCTLETDHTDLKLSDLLEQIFPEEISPEL